MEFGYYGYHADTVSRNEKAIGEYIKTNCMSIYHQEISMK